MYKIKMQDIYSYIYYMLFIYNALYCIGTSAILFWNGIICVYLTSIFFFFIWRLIGAFCGMIPILNLIVLNKIINLTINEVEYEIEKEHLLENELDMCNTKYPILLVHGVFFRDNKYFNYWGRIPKTLEMRGAKIYYGEHQSALAIARLSFRRATWASSERCSETRRS